MTILNLNMKLNSCNLLHAACHRRQVFLLVVVCLRARENYTDVTDRQVHKYICEEWRLRLICVHPLSTQKASLGKPTGAQSGGGISENQIFAVNCLFCLKAAEWNKYAPLELEETLGPQFCEI